MARLESKRVLGYQPKYTGPLSIASYKADNKPDEPTLEKNSGNSTIIMVGLAHSIETGELIRVRMEVTPEDARDIAMGMLALCKQVTSAS